jgi:histone H3/H4
MKVSLPRAGIKRILENTTVSLPPENVSQKSVQCGKKGFKKRKIMNKKTLVSNLQWPNVTLDTLSECGVEFLQLIMTEANEKATEQANKKANAKSTKQAKSVTVKPEFVFDALKTLGFESYINIARLACTEMDDIVETNKEKKRKRVKGKKLTKEQALHVAKEQAVLFAAAAESLDINHL